MTPQETFSTHATKIGQILYVWEIKSLDLSYSQRRFHLYLLTIIGSFQMVKICVIGKRIEREY